MFQIAPFFTLSVVSHHHIWGRSSFLWRPFCKSQKRRKGRDFLKSAKTSFFDNSAECNCTFVESCYCNIEQVLSNSYLPSWLLRYIKLCIALLQNCAEAAEAARGRELFEAITTNAMELPLAASKEVNIRDIIVFQLGLQFSGIFSNPEFISFPDIYQFPDWHGKQIHKIQKITTLVRVVISRIFFISSIRNFPQFDGWHHERNDLKIRNFLKNTTLVRFVISQIFFISSIRNLFHFWKFYPIWWLTPWKNDLKIRIFRKFRKIATLVHHDLSLSHVNTWVPLQFYSEV